MDYTVRLPAEIPRLIFHILRHEEWNYPFTRNGLGYTTPIYAIQAYKEKRRLDRLRWLNLTHVCARWRRLIHDDASLWTDIPAGLGAQWAHMFVSLSKHLPLTVDWDSPVYPRFSPTSTLVEIKRQLYHEVILVHHTRFRNLVAYGIESAADLLLFGALCRPWPELETLDIQLKEGFPEFLLLNGQAPQLRHLTLGSQTNCRALDWMTPILHHLVLLDLEFPGGIDGSMDQFLDSLTDMPSLRHLRLHDSAGYRSTAINPCIACSSKRSAVCLALESFAYNTTSYRTSGTMIHIMRHIVVSQTTRVLLQPLESAWDSVDTGEQISSICTSLSGWYRSYLSLPSFVAAAIIVYDDVIELYLHRDLRPSSRLRPDDDDWWQAAVDGGMYPELAFTFRVGTPNWAAPVVDVLHRLTNPDNIRVLDLELDSDAETEYSLLAFPHSPCLFQNLQILRLPSPLRADELLVAYDRFPSLRVLDLNGRYLSWLLPSRYEGAEYLKAEVLEELRERVPLKVVFLRVADEANAVRAGRFASTDGARAHESLTEAEVRRAIEGFEAIPEVRLISLNEDTQYLSYL